MKDTDLHAVMLVFLVMRNNLVQTLADGKIWWKAVMLSIHS